MVTLRMPVRAVRHVALSLHLVVIHVCGKPAEPPFRESHASLIMDCRHQWRKHL